MENMFEANIISRLYKIRVSLVMCIHALLNPNLM